MTEIMRQRPSILALVGELKAGRMAKHVRVNLERELRRASGSLNHPQEPRRCDRSASLSREDVRARSL
jgi:hypothetical protein